ncbi:hypothetical protein T06_7848 [Trichinella sp. T6]|nr:hypothetical protein T06_7848 [Trichinella sp. T6]
MHQQALRLKYVLCFFVRPTDNNINIEKLHLQNEKPIKCSIYIHLFTFQNLLHCHLKQAQAPMNQVRETLMGINLAKAKVEKSERMQASLKKFRNFKINNFDAKISSTGKA